MKIALDGMGGDDAPRVVVDGALDAVREYGIPVVLVGDKKALENEVSRHKIDKSKIEIVHASEVVHMHEPATTAIRQKKDSSVNVAVNLMKEHKVDAVVAAGNTGAAVCATTFGLGMLAGVERPGIGVIFPTLTDETLLIDVGANINPKPEHLLQYAVMGTIYSEYILKKKNPKVGLLNIGEEETKGTDFLKETYGILEKSKLNFLGNVEGRDIFTGKADVIVCDGFVGNVTLKVAESLSETLTMLLKRELNRNILTKLGALMSMSAFRNLKKEIDYAEYGGAPLLGIDGVCVISHGRSSAKAIKNAVRVAAESVESRLNEHFLDAIKLIHAG